MMMVDTMVDTIISTTNTNSNITEPSLLTINTTSMIANVDNNTAPNPNHSITFANIMGQGRVNQLGGVFINGRPLPQHIRLKIVEMATKGVKPCHISRQLRVSHGCVSKILYRYAETGSVSPGQMGGRPQLRKLSIALEKHIGRIHQAQPIMSAYEIRCQLISKGVCNRSNAPTISTIHRYMRNGSMQNALQDQHISKSSVLKHSIDGILGISVAGRSETVEHLFTRQCRNDRISRTRRNRTSFTQEQLEVLEEAFKANTYPDQELRERIAAATKLDEDKIQVWFSNRRARCRKSLTASIFNPFIIYPNYLTPYSQEAASLSSTVFDVSVPSLLFNSCTIATSATTTTAINSKNITHLS